MKSRRVAPRHILERDKQRAVVALSSVDLGLLLALARRHKTTLRSPSLEPGRSYDVSDPTSAAALSPEEADRVADTASQALEDLSKGLDLIRLAHQKQQVLQGRPEKLRRSNSDAVTNRSGQCEACERTVTGTGNDRLRGGLCPSCERKYRRWRDEQPATASTDRSIDQWHRWCRLQEAG